MIFYLACFITYKNFTPNQIQHYECIYFFHVLICSTGNGVHFNPSLKLLCAYGVTRIHVKIDSTGLFLSFTALPWTGVVLKLDKGHDQIQVL